MLSSCPFSESPPSSLVDRLAHAAQKDSDVKGYRSFANLTEGKAVCVMEADDKDEVSEWFTKMGMPCDSITKVELEGDHGNIKSV